MMLDEAVDDNGGRKKRQHLVPRHDPPSIGTAHRTQTNMGTAHSTPSIGAAHCSRPSISTALQTTRNPRPTQHTQHTADYDVNDADGDDDGWNRQQLVTFLYCT